MNGQRAPRPWSVAVNKRGGRFVVDVSLPEAGKRRVYRKKFMARRSADDLANAIRVRLGEGKTPFETAEEAAPAVTVVGVVDLYATREGGQTSRALQHRSAFLKTALGARPAEEFALADLEGYIRERQPVSAATCAKDFRHLKAALAYAKAKDRISAHYFEKLSGDKVTRRRLIPAYRAEDSTGDPAGALRGDRRESAPRREARGGLRSDDGLSVAGGRGARLAEALRGRAVPADRAEGIEDAPGGE